MICTKCKNELEEDAKYCNKCGQKINSNKNWGFSYNKEIKNDEYLNAYLGDDISLFEKKISIFAILLGPFYLLYRKLFAQSFIILVIYILSYQYLPPDIGIIFRVCFNLYLGINFNNYYLEEVKTNIKRIKKKNQELSKEELLLKLKQASPTTNIGLIILIILLYFIILALLQSKGIKTMDKATKDSIENNHLSYFIPKEAEIKTNYNNYQHFSYEDNKKKCYITIYSQYMTKNEEEYLADISNNHNKYRQSDIKEVEINKVIWLQRSFEKTNAYQDFYLMKYKDDNRLYEMRFDSSEKDACNEIKSIIIKSISYK